MERPANAAFRVEEGPAGLRVLVFDQPGARVNLLTESVLDELRLLLESLSGDSALSGLLIVCGKPGQFIAGADVAAIRDVREAGEGQAKAAFGQAVYERLANFPRPTAAAIDGACMGGGLELALACRYRFASDAPGTRLALPEVRLGILPAFGGTTRLSRLLGLVPALDLLLTGKSLDGRRARRAGLVDDVLPREDFRERAERAFQERIRSGKPAATSRGVPRWMRALIDGNPAGRALVLSRARRRVLRETGGHYPAPIRILDVLERSVGRPASVGFSLETEAAGDLIVHPVTRNLIALFQMSEKAKKDPATPEAAEVRRAAVLGAGVMGGGIAALFASSGIPVRLKDVRHEAVANGLAHARGLFERERRRGRVSEREVARRMALLSGTLAYDGMRHVDVVVEAVVENLDVKRQVLGQIAERVPPRTVLATNTSSLRIEDIAQGLPDPDRIVGLHFFNPVHRMPLVEVVVAEGTRAAARDTVVALARRLGKTPVVVRSSPGFLVNRVLMPYLEEALRLFQAGVPMEELDQALVGFGMPMGPMELLDEVGLDVAWKVAKVLGEAFPGGDRPNILGPLVEAGRLGKKSGRGFYRYAQGSKQPDPAVYSLVSSPSRSAVQSGPDAWVERLLLAMINEAARCLEARVVSSGEQVDLAMIMGTGFPPFRGGLLRYADVLGIARVSDRLAALAETEGPHFAPCGLVRQMRESKGKFREDLAW